MTAPLSGRFLILDDDAAVGQTMLFIAEDAGMEARWVAAPAAFIEQVDMWNPTHIAIDLIMPEMDGVEVMRLLAERSCQAYIIISSGVGHRVLDAARRAAAEHGLNMAGVLSKPFMPAALRALLANDREAGPWMEASAVNGPEEITEAALSEALIRRQFSVVYQPKVSCSSGELSGFEALARWNHPEHGLIRPDRFIPKAEACGLINALTEQIFDQAMAWFAHNFPDSDISLSLNLSAKSLGDFQLGERLAEISRNRNVAASRIILELTESSAMENPTTSLALLTRLRMQGYELSIDDFGAGFSSMVQLARLPFSEMKIDKSFVISALESEESRIIIRSIIDLGHGLNLRITAEGVENRATLLLLKGLGCDLAQGYFIARPMKGDSVLNWMKDWAERCRLLFGSATGA